MLPNWQKDCEEAARVASIALDPNGFIFMPDPTGKTFWKPDSCGRACRRSRLICCPNCRYKKKPELNCPACHGKRQIMGSDVTLLEVRHFTATQLIPAGLDVVTVAGVLGRHPAVTVSNYAAWQRQGGQQAASTITDVVFGQRQTIAQLEPVTASKLRQPRR